MPGAEKQPFSSLAPLAHAWLGLVLLTLASLALGHWFHGATWLQPLVAAIVWLKGVLVTHRFIEIKLAHSFIRRVVVVFVAFTPLALLVVTYFGSELARWTSL